MKMEKMRTSASAVSYTHLDVYKRQGQTLTAAVVLPEKLDAPVAAGTQVATVTLKAGEEILGEYPVTTRSEVPQMDWGTALSLLTKALFTL